MNGNEKIGTGTTLDCFVNGIKTNTYTMVILGDVNGDGALNLNDLASVRDNIFGINPIKGPYKQAGDLYDEGTITLNDLVGMMADISGSQE